MEGAATTVYAQGGRGNSRLMAWEGERTVTFTMEDALISPAGFMILSGAGLVDAKEKPIMVHTTETTSKVKVDVDAGTVTIELENKPYIGEDKDGNPAFNGEDYIYVMLMDGDEVVTEPFIPSDKIFDEDNKKYSIVLKQGNWEDTGRKGRDDAARNNSLEEFFNIKGDVVVLVDYYVKKTSGASEITITPDKFGGYYYLEASTLFRNTDGVDMPAEFVIPNCKIQSNFTFTMASSGDPSTFTFTIDAFPDYTRFDKTKKVLAAIQIVTAAEGSEELTRVRTKSNDWEDVNGMIAGEVRPIHNEITGA